MFPDPPPQLVQTAEQGPLGGPSYSYRGARIERMKGGCVCGLFMPGHPLYGSDHRGFVTVVGAKGLQPKIANRRFLSPY
jgi:hypothetical protein